MNFRGPFSNVALGWDDQPVDWCGHYHNTADEANECQWAPPVEPWSEIYILEDFYPIFECEHGLHPTECERCSLVQCVHEQHPDQCARCIRFASGDFGELYDQRECGQVEELPVHREGGGDDPDAVRDQLA